MTQYQNNLTTKEKFYDLQIEEINVRKILTEIIDKAPSIGIPIDEVSQDLTDWAKKTLKYRVKLWKISKYVELNNPENIFYEFPEEFKPELATQDDFDTEMNKSEISKYNVSISDLIESGFLCAEETLEMSYKPRNGDLQKYKAIIQKDGSLEILDQVFSSPSNAALVGIQNAGSERKTVNGWTSWKNEKGETLADLRDKYLNLLEEKNTIDEGVVDVDV